MGIQEYTYHDEKIKLNFKNTSGQLTSVFSFISNKINACNYQNVTKSRHTLVQNKKYNMLLTRAKGNFHTPQTRREMWICSEG